MRYKLPILLAIMRRRSDQEAIDRSMKEDGFFYAWQCVSVLTDKRTVDFIVPVRTQLLCLVNGLQAAVYK